MSVTASAAKLQSVEFKQFLLCPQVIINVKHMLGLYSKYTNALLTSAPLRASMHCRPCHMHSDTEKTAVQCTTYTTSVHYEK